MLTDSTGKNWWTDFWNRVLNVIDVIIGAVASVILVAAGICLTVFSGGAYSGLGLTLIAAGIGGFIGGIQSKMDGGSFLGGYLGGAISSGLTALGILFGPIGALLGGFVGNFAGNIVTDFINGEDVGNGKYLLYLFAESLLSSVVAIGAWKFGTVTKLLNTSGFRDVYVKVVIWSEFTFSGLLDSIKNYMHQIADQINRKFLYI